MIRLPSLVPDDTRSAIIQARCHAALAKRRRAQTRRQARGAFGQRAALAMIGASILIYVSAVIRNALAIYGVL